jgi:hypothetical protein
VKDIVIDQEEICVPNRVEVGAVLNPTLIVAIRHSVVNVMRSMSVLPEADACTSVVVGDIPLVEDPHRLALFDPLPPNRQFVVSCPRDRRIADFHVCAKSKVGCVEPASYA